MSVLSIIGLLVFPGVLWFAWTKLGLREGRAYRNRLAEHLGVPRNLFHQSLDDGVNGPSLMLLSTLEKSGMSLDQVAVELGPSLARGLDKFDARFGRLPMTDAIRPTVAKLSREWERKQEK